MCLNKRFVQTQIGSMLVKCGHCEACQQEKAFKRTNRIRNTFRDDGSLMALFITLHYDNNSVPYFMPDEFYDSPVLYDDEIGQYREMRIYRDCVLTRNKKRREDKTVVLETLQVPVYYNTNGFKELQNKKDCVGVQYYKDAQDFMKRLRINLKRKYHYNERIKYFLCSEIGPKTGRPHLHGLLFIPRCAKSYMLFKSAIAESWPFGDNYRTRRYVEIAKNVASYISSYVNSHNDVPDVFRRFTPLRPHHSYSTNFGMEKEYCSLSWLLKHVDAGDLHLPLSCAGILSPHDVRVLLPKYVICRYFRKIKGFGDLTFDEIVSICTGRKVNGRSLTLFDFAHRLNYDWDDYRRNQIMLDNMIERFRSLSGLNAYDFALYYYQVWNVYYSNIQTDIYKTILTEKDNFYAYDNIGNFWTTNVTSLSLVALLNDGICPDIIYDPNEFECNKREHSRLMEMFASYDKSKKTRDHIDSQLNKRYYA